MGRGEKLYKYSGFDRKISMAFTVVAQSKNELNVMYNKLNFLASSLAPEYIDSLTSGYMAGNIAYINVGDYLSDQPGIITSLNYEIPEESPWEIERNNYSLRQLPHMIKVSLSFTPIHKFRPSKQSWANDWNKKGLGISTSTVIATPGNQKFIDPLSRYSPDKDINISLPTKPAQTIPSKGLAQQNIISNQIISDEVANTSIKLGNTLWNR
jgi:hypothetical protein